ncbi:hypothetical protein LCGC14_2518040 [marine sediment metagenome]|uniref:Uncharacterized protein n=1 Tax=marine sediment metagenome TaxID=412755 RepID=A0A0F9AX96_9ZZZZ
MSRKMSNSPCTPGCVRVDDHLGACLLSREEQMCTVCKGEGEVGGYFEKDACYCCTEGGCGPGSGCGCWHQGENCGHCGGTGLEP